PSPSAADAVRQRTDAYLGFCWNDPVHTARAPDSPICTTVSTDPTAVTATAAASTIVTVSRVTRAGIRGLPKRNHAHCASATMKTATAQGSRVFPSAA